jgi:hypothetical protein
VYGEPQNKENTLIYVTSLDGVLVNGEEPIKSVLSLFQALQADHFDILIIADRPENSRRSTLYWLSQYGLQANRMYMKQDGDDRPSHVVKAEMYDRLVEEHPGHMIMGVFESDPQTVCSLRMKGATVFHCLGAK